MKKGKVIIISGPSGSGKTTLHKMLLSSPRVKGKLVKSISATTRLRREGERQGRDYLFLGKEEFKRKIKQRYFVEWQKVFGNYYGTPKKAVEDVLKTGKNVLLCIDVKGARVFGRICPEAIKIFITVPSLDVLMSRLTKRGSETRANLKRRLDTAKKELAEAKRYQHIIVNDRLPKAFRKLEGIVAEKLGS